MDVAIPITANIVRLPRLGGRKKSLQCNDWLEKEGNNNRDEAAERD